MAPRYMSVRVKLLITLSMLLMFGISTGSTKRSTPKKTDVYVINNIGIKLCQLKCAEHGQCVNIEYYAETLTCCLSTNESKKKEGHANLARSHSHVPSGMCKLGQRYLKTRSGKGVCVEASTDRSQKYTVPPVSETTEDLQASTTDASQDLTPRKTVPPTPVTTQDSDDHATVSPRAGRDLYDASKRGDLERVKRILAAGHVDINYRGGWGSKTPVMLAARYGHRAVVEFLVGRWADVSLVNSSGNNVLHLACLGGDLETVKLILSLDMLNVNTRTNSGRTAADLARTFGHQRLVNLLVSRGAH